MKDPADSRFYWRRVEKLLTRRGLTFADVDIVYNKNVTTCGRRGETPCGAPTEILRQELVDGIVAFQREVLLRMPQVVGYHGIRSHATWCKKAPQRLAEVHREAIIMAVEGVSNWSVGPDLSTPTYERSDFVKDGCHPSPAGLAKMTPIIDTFFNDAGKSVQGSATNQLRLRPWNAPTR